MPESFSQDGSAAKRPNATAATSQPPSAARRAGASPSAPGARTASAAERGGGGAYPESVSRLITELAKLPGIGRRSAERLAFHILKATGPEAMGLARAIRDVKQRVRHCRVCYNLCDFTAAATVESGAAPAQSALPDSSDSTLCAICDPARETAAFGSQRDRGLVMVVEQPKDLIALEQTGMFRGVYHVLMGRISPLEGVNPGDLTIVDLLARIDHPERNPGSIAVREVVLALNPTLEGDGTGLYLAEQLSERRVSLTRLARGLPTGSTLEFASKAVLADAIEGRRPV